MDADKAVFAQGSEVLGNGCLRDAELVLDDFGKASGAALAADEEFQNPSPHRIAENIKSMHSGLGKLQPCPV